MRTYRKESVVETLHAQGMKLVEGIQRSINQLGLSDYFQVLGRPCNLVYATLDQGRQRSQEFRALFLQETIRRGLLLPSLVVSFAHTDEDIRYSVDAIADALVVYRRALDEGIEKYLVGRPVKPVFRKFN